MTQKQLVAFFSASGTTRRTATQLAEIVGADILEIEPKQPYTSADLDWNNPNSRSSLEMTGSSNKLELAENALDLANYEEIFVGYPIWWGKAPKIVEAFFRQYDWKGKTIIPFCTSGGSGFGSSDQALKEATNEQVKWLQGRELTSSNRKTMEHWVLQLKSI